MSWVISAIVVVVVLGCALVLIHGVKGLPSWLRRKPKVPNPGSQQAGRAGCICPVGQNNQGKEKPANGWIVRGACELHGDMETRHTRDNGGLYR